MFWYAEIVFMKWKLKILNFDVLHADIACMKRLLKMLSMCESLNEMNLFYDLVVSYVILT